MRGVLDTREGGDTKTDKQVNRQTMRPTHRMADGRNEKEVGER